MAVHQPREPEMARGRFPCTNLQTMTRTGRVGARMWGHIPAPCGELGTVMHQRHC